MTDPAPEPTPSTEPEPKPDDFKPITTQADLDRVVGARLAREREKFADYGDLKAKAEKYDKALDAARTEQEKAVEAAKAEGRTEALSAANSRLVSAEARAAAATAKFRDPADAVAFLDLADIKVADDGSVDGEAIKVKLADLAAKKPYLLSDDKPTRRTDKSQGGGGGDDHTPSVRRGREMFAERHPQKTA